MELLYLFSSFIFPRCCIYGDDEITSFLYRSDSFSVKVNMITVHIFTHGHVECVLVLIRNSYCLWIAEKILIEFSLTPYT
jgi:hypothetical protein